MRLKAGEKSALLDQFSVDELKAEVQHRKIAERAVLHLPSAERALQKAQARVDAYRSAIAEEERRQAILRKKTK